MLAAGINADRLLASCRVACPACSSASHAHSRKIRCCGSMICASRGRQAEKTGVEQFRPLRAWCRLRTNCGLLRSAGTTPAASRSASPNVSSDSVPARTLRQKSSRSRAPGNRPAKPTIATPACVRELMLANARSQPWTCLSARACARSTAALPERQRIDDSRSACAGDCRALEQLDQRKVPWRIRRFRSCVQTAREAASARPDQRNFRAGRPVRTAAPRATARRHGAAPVS